MSVASTMGCLAVSPLRGGVSSFMFPSPRRTEPNASKQAAGRQLNFLANVDPIDVARALKGLDPEETLVVVVSKTFTTAETMLNARTVRQWLRSHLGEEGRGGRAAEDGGG